MRQTTTIAQFECQPKTSVVNAVNPVAMAKLQSCSIMKKDASVLAFPFEANVKYF